MKHFIRPFALCFLVLCSSFGATHSVQAGNNRKTIKPPPKTIYTAIASVDATAGTISTESKNAASVTARSYKISPKVKVSLNGKEGTVTDLKPGLQVRIGAGMDGGVAEEIIAMTPPPDPTPAKKR